MKPKYNIGDTVWFAHRKIVTDRVICPECFGKKILTVILGDNSKVEIDCMGCASRLENPRGYCEYYKQEITVKQIAISGFECNGIKTRYRFDSCYIVDEEDVFDTKEATEVRAKELAEQHNKEELDRIYRKEKNHKNWAWHVYYYRNQIRSALKDIEYAEKCLHIAKQKSKQEGKEA